MELLKVLFKNLYVKLLLVVVGIVVVFTLFQRTGSTDRILKTIADMTNQQLKQTLQEVQDQRDIYKNASEQLSQKYNELEIQKQSLEMERNGLKKKILNLDTQLTQVKERKLVEPSKEKKQLAAQFTTFGFSAHIRNCQ